MITPTVGFILAVAVAFLRPPDLLLAGNTPSPRVEEVSAGGSSGQSAVKSLNPRGPGVSEDRSVHGDAEIAEVTFIGARASDIKQYRKQVRGYRNTIKGYLEQLVESSPIHISMELYEEIVKTLEEIRRLRNVSLGFPRFYDEMSFDSYVYEVDRHIRAKEASAALNILRKHSTQVDDDRFKGYKITLGYSSELFQHMTALIVGFGEYRSVAFWNALAEMLKSYEDSSDPRIRVLRHMVFASQLRLDINSAHIIVATYRALCAPSTKPHNDDLIDFVTHILAHKSLPEKFYTKEMQKLIGPFVLSFPLVLVASTPLAPGQSTTFLLNILSSWILSLFRSFPYPSVVSTISSLLTRMELLDVPGASDLLGLLANNQAPKVETRKLSDMLKFQIKVSIQRATLLWLVLHNLALLRHGDYAGLRKVISKIRKVLDDMRLLAWMKELVHTVRLSLKAGKRPMLRVSFGAPFVMNSIASLLTLGAASANFMVSSLGGELVKQYSFYLSLAGVNTNAILQGLYGAAVASGAAAVSAAASFGLSLIAMLVIKFRYLQFRKTSKLLKALPKKQRLFKLAIDSSEDMALLIAILGNYLPEMISLRNPFKNGMKQLLKWFDNKMSSLSLGFLPKGKDRLLP